MRIKILILFLFLWSVVFVSVGQNNTNSPYTRFGYGDIHKNAAGEYQAMGGTTMAMRSNRSINPANPASYTAVDSLTFMLDMGISGQLTHFSDASGIKNVGNGNLEYLTIQFPFTRWLACSAGLIPYSFVGYEFAQNNHVLMPSNPSLAPDTITYTSMFYGTGGVSQVYLGLSFELFKHVSLGANAYYMFGKVNNFRQLSFANSEYASVLQENRLTVSDVRFRFGAQFYHTFAKKHYLNLGLAYEFKSKLNGSFSQIETTTSDTTQYGIAGFDIPSYYSAGLAYTYDNRLTIAVDYALQEWSKANYFGRQDSLNNTHQISLGGEYRHNPLGNKYIDRMAFRVGANVSTPYIKEMGSTQKNFGITFGIGLPLRTSKTFVNATFEYGKKGSLATLREDYFKLTISASFNELWFFKRKL